MPSEPSADAAALPWQRWTVLVLALLVIGHTALLALWLAPSNPASDAIGTRTLSSYVDPYFQQGPETVGLQAQQVDESFSIRAVLQGPDGGASRVSRWVDVTAAETRSARGRLDTSRADLSARRLATNLNLAMFRLSDRQRRTVSRITARDLASQVRARLLRSGGNTSSIRSFQAYDQMATQFASLYARAHWRDEEVLQVQYRVGRRTVPPFADRSTTPLVDVKFSTFGFGWRRAFRGSIEARESFTSYAGPSTP